MYYVSDIVCDIEDKVLSDLFWKKVAECSDESGHVWVGLLIQNCQYLRNRYGDYLFMTFDFLDHHIIVSD